MRIEDLVVDRKHLEAICNTYRVRSLEVFGSFADGAAQVDSDLDLLVSFEPAARIGLNFIDLQQELTVAFGRKVDLITRQAVEDSPNKYFRHFALRATIPIYEHA